MVILIPVTKKEFKAIHANNSLEILDVTRLNVVETIVKLDSIPIDKVRKYNAISTSHIDLSDGNGVVNKVYKCELEELTLYFVETIYNDETYKSTTVYRRKR